MTLSCRLALAGLLAPQEQFTGRGAAAKRRVTAGWRCGAQVATTSVFT